jgi:hypothetical protein
MANRSIITSPIVPRPRPRISVEAILKAGGGPMADGIPVDDSDDSRIRDVADAA